MAGLTPSGQPHAISPSIQSVSREADEGAGGRRQREAVALSQADSWRGWGCGQLGAVELRLRSALYPGYTPNRAHQLRTNLAPVAAGGSTNISSVLSAASYPVPKPRPTLIQRLADVAHSAPISHFQPRHRLPCRLKLVSGEPGPHGAFRVIKCGPVMMALAPQLFQKYRCHSTQECGHPAHGLLGTNSLTVTSSHPFCLREGWFCLQQRLWGKPGCAGGREMDDGVCRAQDPPQSDGVLHGASRSPQGRLSTPPQPSEVGSLCCFPARGGDVLFGILAGFLPLFQAGCSEEGRDERGSSEAVS